MSRLSTIVLLISFSSVLGCSEGESAESAAGCADVIAAEAVSGTNGFTFTVTVRSSDTGWDKYADLWEVVGPDGGILGTRMLTHPHTEEQPFTRSLSGVTVPDGTERVIVRARDSVEGFCGAELELDLPR